MTKEFVKQNNKAVVASLLLLEALNHPEMQKSAWFNSRNIKRSILTKKELEKMWQRVLEKDIAEYRWSMEEMVKTFNIIIEGTYETDAKGYNHEYINVLNNSVKITDTLMAKMKKFGSGMAAKINMLGGGI